MNSFSQRQAQRDLTKKLLARTKRSTKGGEQGFTLVELLVVVVILGVLSAVGVPAYLSQANKAKANAANVAAMAAAKSCSALLVTGDTADFKPGDGVTPTTCAVGDYTAVIEGKTAVATVGTNGDVSLKTKAVP